MAIFTQYAIAAADEALRDAGLQDMGDEDRENTVRHPGPAQSSPAWPGNTPQARSGGWLG